MLSKFKCNSALTYEDTLTDVELKTQTLFITRLIYRKKKQLQMRNYRFKHSPLF